MSDFLDGCNEQGMKVTDFEHMFCDFCRNPECDRAKWADSLFTQRIMTQENRLLNPQQADPTLSKYEPLQRAVFKDMLEQAVRLEIANRRGDWVVPEIGATLDVTETPEQIIERAVRQAVKFQPKEEGDLSKEEMTPEGTPTQADDPIPPQVTGTPVIISAAPKVFIPRAHNTSVPTGGIMLGGASAPAPPAQEADPWAAPPESAGKKIPVGGSVRMGTSATKEAK